MSDRDSRAPGDSLNIIWTIASKDIVDALKNKVVISMIIMSSIILLLPKMLPALFEQPQTVLPIYDMGESHLVETLKKVPDISIQTLNSEEELSSTLCGSIYPLIGLRLPADFDKSLARSGEVEIQGELCWSKRGQASGLQTRLEGILAQALDRPVILQVEGNIVYPPAEKGLMLSLATVNSVLLILMMGIFLVPSLLLEEKDTRTLQALLVSPASIGQVVIGKALAGSFYILVTGGVIFAISWVEVVHWGMVMLFVLGGGFFSVAVGLMLGSFFEKGQDTIGCMTALLLLLVVAVLIKMIGVELPAFVAAILPWVPSIAVAELCRSAFSETVSAARVWTDLLVILAISLPLYLLVIWKVRRSDR